jgi:hypothetical protein
MASGVRAEAKKSLLRNCKAAAGEVVVVVCGGGSIWKNDNNMSQPSSPGPKVRARSRAEVLVVLN